MDKPNKTWGGLQAGGVKQRLNESSKAYLFANLLRNPALFLLAKNQFDSSVFDRMTEVPYIILWSAALNVAKNNNNQLPTSVIQAKALITLEAQAIADASPSNIVGAGGIDALFRGPNGGLIDILYAYQDEELDEQTAKTLLRAFLEERQAFDPLQRLITGTGQNAIPADLDTIIQRTQEVKNRIAAIDLSPIEDVAPEGWEVNNELLQVPTNINFLDSATEGGPALGEVITLLGPSGGGKTLLCVMIAVNGAKLQNDKEYKAAGRPSGYWYYLTYESPVKPDLRRRVISYAAEIDHNTLKTMKSLDQLSTRGKLREYEKRRWKGAIDDGIDVAGEFERYDVAIQTLGNRLKMVDMSGAINPAFGTGGIQEIVQYLTDGASKGFPPIGVIIDYAGIAVDRYMAAHNKKMDDEFRYLNQFVNTVRVEVANRFNCIVWIAHQLHGDSAAAGPTVRQHHSKARGARNFSDNANFAFNIGTKDESNNCCIITCSKHRRTDSVKDPPIVIINGALNRMDTEDGRYAMDPGTRRIVDSKLRGMVADAATLESTGTFKFNKPNRRISMGDDTGGAMLED